MLARNVESRDSAMFHEGFGGWEPGEALRAPAILGMVSFAVSWITCIWRIIETQTFADDRELEVIVVVWSSGR